MNENEFAYLKPNRIDAELFTTSEVIAEFAGVQHHTVIRLIQQHEDDFKEFGILRFQIEKIRGRGQPRKNHQLNEEQAALLMTYLTNTEKVRAFKKKLVRQFYAMRTELLQLQMRCTELNPIRQELTDVIREVCKGKVKRKTGKNKKF